MRLSFPEPFLGGNPRRRKSQESVGEAQPHLRSVELQVPIDGAEETKHRIALKEVTNKHMRLELPNSKKLLYKKQPKNYKKQATFRRTSNATVPLSISVHQLKKKQRFFQFGNVQSLSIIPKLYDF